MNPVYSSSYYINSASQNDFKQLAESYNEPSHHLYLIAKSDDNIQIVDREEFKKTSFSHRLLQNISQAFRTRFYFEPDWENKKVLLQGYKAVLEHYLTEYKNKNFILRFFSWMSGQPQEAIEMLQSINNCENCASSIENQIQQKDKQKEDVKNKIQEIKNRLKHTAHFEEFNKTLEELSNTPEKQCQSIIKKKCELSYDHIVKPEEIEDLEKYISIINNLNHTIYYATEQIVHQRDGWEKL